MLVENLPVPLDRRVWQEAQTLRDAGYRVTVIGPVGAGPMAARDEHLDGIDVLRYPQRAASGLGGYVVEYPPSLYASARLLRVAEARSPVSVVHVANPPDLLFLAARRAIGRGARLVFDQHDANPELVVAKWGRSPVGRAMYGVATRVERASFDRADLVLSPNESYAQLAVDRGGVPADRVTVVRNAPVAATRAVYAEAAREHRPEPGVLRLAYLGVMGTQDGVELLLDSLPRVLERHPGLEVRLDLVGDGESRPGLERRVPRSPRLAVRFHGYLEPGAFAPLLAGCDLGVCPDPPTAFNAVSTMTKVGDYLAMGLPVVGFDLADTARCAGPAGALVGGADAAGRAGALGDAVADLAGDPERLATMRAAAAGQVDRAGLTWEHSAAELVSAYDRMLAAPARR